MRRWRLIRDKGVQPGFSPNHRVEDAEHGLVEGVKHNRNDGNRVVILLSADVKKAYPSMPRGKMLEVEAVADMGVTGKLYLAIAAPRTTGMKVLSSPRMSRWCRGRTV
jgi:hypothetical protein